MLFRQPSRPAYAFATTANKQSTAEKKIDNFAFASSQSNDFNSFSSSGASGAPNRPPQKPERRKVTLEIPGRSIAMAAAVLVGIVLVITLLSSWLFSRTDNILYEDNAFVAYQDLDGNYRVAMNGKVLKDVFMGEIKLTEAKNNAFAYVEAPVDGATNVYVLKKGKLQLMCEGVDKVLALADYEPGVIYKYGNRVEYSFDGLLTSLARNDDYTPENFVISPDGTAVAYTIKNKNNTAVHDLYVYTVDQSAPEVRTAGTVSTIPVSISNNGVYVVAYTEKADARDLYLFAKNSYYKIGGVDGQFNSLVYANADASEIIFTTKNGENYRSYVYNCSEIKKDATSAHHISNGYAVPQIVDPKICAPESFKKSYFQDAVASLTIYVNKKYQAIKVSDYLGQIDSDKRFLYIINEQRDNMLIQIELLGERFGKDDNRSTSIAPDVKDFVITKKGNVYYTDGYGDLYFYKLTKGKASRITNDVEDFIFYNYANELYFEKNDSAEVSGIYKTEEGSDHNSLKLSKTAPSSLPSLTNTYSKKSYAFYHDETADTYLIFYTANGRSFKQIAECAKITFSHENQLAKLIDDLT